MDKVDTALGDIANIAHKFRGKTVLITGASGFIGGRLAERLLLECDVRPRVLLRDYSRAARLARYGIERFDIALGSLDDAAAIDRAISGTDVVFHCAYDPSKAGTNVGGIQAIIRACIKHQARLVHVSTISVYEPLSDGDLDEVALPVRSGLPYSENKLDVDEQVLEAVRINGLDAVVLMPTIVYGPFSKPWTMAPAKQIASGTVLLPENGQGLCNAVHVDDVCQGLIRAAVVPEAKGRRYFLSGDKPVTWGAFYDAIAKALGRPGPKSMPRRALDHRNKSPLSAMLLLLGDPKRIIRWAPTRALAMWAKDNLGPAVKERIKQAYKIYRRVAPSPVYTPDEGKMALFSAKCTVIIDRARSELDYKPKYNFDEGMKDTGAWIRWALPKEG